MGWDDDPENADWIKSRWDVWTSGPDGHVVSTLAELRAALPGQSDAMLKSILDLPVARYLPEPLRSELAAL